MLEFWSLLILPFTKIFFHGHADKIGALKAEHALKGTGKGKGKSIGMVAPTDAEESTDNPLKDAPRSDSGAFPII